MASNHGDGGFKVEDSVEQPQDKASDLMTNQQSYKQAKDKNADKRLGATPSSNHIEQETQQTFSRKLDEDYRSSHFNKSDTAHFYEASSGLPNQDISGRISNQYSDEKQFENNPININTNRLIGTKQNGRQDSKFNEPIILNRSVQINDLDEDDIIDEIIDTDPDEEEPHPVDDPIDSLDGDKVTNLKQQNTYHSMNEYKYFADEIDEEAINQSVDRINPQEMKRNQQHINSKDQDHPYVQIGTHLPTSKQGQIQSQYHSYKSSISSPSLVLEGGSIQDNEISQMNESESQLRNMRFGTFQTNRPLSAAKKRPSDKQSRGERRLLSANAKKGNGGSTNEESQHFNNTMTNQTNSMYVQNPQVQNVQSQQVHQNQNQQVQRSNQQIYIQNQANMMAMQRANYHQGAPRYPYGPPQQPQMNQGMRVQPQIFYRQVPPQIMMDPRQRMYSQINMDNGQSHVYPPPQQSLSPTGYFNHPQTHVSSPLRSQSQQSPQYFSHSMHNRTSQSFSLGLEFQRKVSPYPHNLNEIETHRDRAPKSINDTNIDQFTKYKLQQSHIKASAKRIEQLKDQSECLQPTQEIIILNSINGASRNNTNDIYLQSSKLDTESNTNVVDLSNGIDKQTPVKVDETDAIESLSQNSQKRKALTDKKQQSNNQQSYKKKLALIRDEEALDYLKREAIKVKKELRLKRFNYKKQQKFEEDTELNMIMTYNAGKQEMPQMSSDSKMSGNNSGSSSYHAYYQQQQQQNQLNQQMYNNQQAPNQDLINLENNMQYQEQERRNKRQQQQLQEQQFRLSMSSMKNQISEVIKEELNESQRSNTGRESPRQDEGSMIQQDNNFDEEVVGEIEDMGDNRRKQSNTQQEKKHQSNQQHQQQPSVTPRSQQIQCLEVDETEFSKIQKLIDNEDTKKFDSEPNQKMSLNKDLEEIESKKNGEADEIQDQIQELLDQKTDEVKQQINKAEKKQQQKMSYQMLFQTSFYSQKQEIDQVDVESPGIKTEQVARSNTKSVEELDDQKQEQQNEKLIEFQQQLERLQKMTNNLTEFVERGNQQEENMSKSQQDQIDLRDQQKHIEFEENIYNKDNQESAAQQSQLFDKSTVHTLKEDKNLRDQNTSGSEHVDQEGIINIKTNKIQFKKSQSMRKIKGGKDTKMKKIKFKRGTKRNQSKEAKNDRLNLTKGRKHHNNLQFPKKSHSLDSMQHHSFVSPTYGSMDFNANPTAYYAMHPQNYDMRYPQPYQYQQQFVGNVPKAKWRSNSPKKDPQLIRRSSYSPVNEETPIHYELQQQLKNQGMNMRDFRSERKMLKSAHPNLIKSQQQQYLHNATTRYMQRQGTMTKQSSNIKKIKLKKMASTMGPNSKQQKFNDTRIIMRNVHTAQGNMVYTNRHDQAAVPVGNNQYQRMGTGPQVINNFVGPVNMPMITRHQLMRSATARLDSANSFQTSQGGVNSVGSMYQTQQLQKGMIKPIPMYKQGQYGMMPPSDAAQSRSQILPAHNQQGRVPMRLPAGVGQGPNIMAPRPPRQSQKDHITSGGLVRNQNAMMDQQIMQRHRSAKSSLRPNALNAPLMPASGMQMMPPSQQLKSQQNLRNEQQRQLNSAEGIHRNNPMYFRYKNQVEGDQKLSMYQTAQPQHHQSVGQLIQMNQPLSGQQPNDYVKQSPYNQRLRLPKSGMTMKKQSSGSILQNRLAERQLNPATVGQGMQRVNSLNNKQGYQSLQRNQQLKGSLPILHMDGLV